MRRMKKALACSLSLAMVCGMMAGCSDKKDEKPADNKDATVAPEATKAPETQAPADGGDTATPDAAESWDPAAGTTGGKTLRIYCWNTEFQERFDAYYKDKLPADLKVDWVINPNENNVYQNKLDEALQKQASANPEDRIDIFLMESDYAYKYIKTDFPLDIINDVKITDAQLADQYQYTKDVVTYDGKLKGLSWQACPQGFIYRRSIAKDVLGTDDPVEVQKAIDDWSLFDQTAAKMKEKGYFMLSGYDDSYRAYSNNMSAPWVDSEYKIHIDDQINNWIKQTKDYTEKGYNNKANLFSEESKAQMGKNGKVFGYFGPAWFIDFCFTDFTFDDPEAPHEVGNGSFGDWALTKGPIGSFWGGTWVCAARGTDNIDVVRDVLLNMTTNKEILTNITKDKGDFCNSVSAMTEIANDSSFGYPILGGQNHIAVLLDSAQDIHITASSAYDQTMAEKIQSSMKDYYDGVCDLDTAWNNFYDTVMGIHPELVK